MRTLELNLSDEFSVEISKYGITLSKICSCERFYLDMDEIENLEKAIEIYKDMY
jgi:hypothetical protein